MEFTMEITVPPRLPRNSLAREIQFSIEDINSVVRRWGKYYDHSSEEMEQTREFLLALKPLEDVDVRLCNGEIQWRIWYPHITPYGEYKPVPIGGELQCCTIE